MFLDAEIEKVLSQKTQIETLSKNRSEQMEVHQNFDTACH